jgi:hypothetical protein
MRRPGFLLAVVVLLLALVPFGRWLMARSELQALGTSLAADVARPAKVLHTPAPKMPQHEDALVCFGGLVDVAPKDLSPFVGPQAAALAAAAPTPETQARLRELSPWIQSMRECANSVSATPTKKLVPGARPATPVSKVGEALVNFSALELRTLVNDMQVDLALERCTATWELAFDLTHLGFEGASVAEAAVRTLEAPCTDALGKVKPEVAAQVKKSWAALEARLAPAERLVEHARLDTALTTYAWVLPAEQRTGLLHVTVPTDTSQSRRVAGEWSAYDAMMRAVAPLAATPGDARKAAAGPELEAKLAAYDELRAAAKRLGQ